MHFSERWKALLGYARTRSPPTGPTRGSTSSTPTTCERLRREIDHHLAGEQPALRERAPHPPRRRQLALGAHPRPDDARRRRAAAAHHRLAVGHHRPAQAQERLIHDALHDSLTGLPNRALLHGPPRRSACATSSATRPTRCAVLYIDIDRFKLVNDSLSHAAGDRLLIEIARRVGAGAAPGRHAGAPGRRRVRDPARRRRRRPPARWRSPPASRRAIAEPLALRPPRAVGLGSIGIAHNLDGCVSPDELIRNADIAMYDAKAHGGGRCEVFDASHAPARRRPRVAGDAAAPGDRAAAAAHVLPADRRPAQRRAARPRGAGALARRRRVASRRRSSSRSPRSPGLIGAARRADPAQRVRDAERLAPARGRRARR